MSKISTAARPRTNAERALRDAARLVYRERMNTVRGATPAKAWDRVTDLIDCDLVSIVRRDEEKLAKIPVPQAAFDAVRNG